MTMPIFDLEEFRRRQLIYKDGLHHYTIGGVIAVVIFVICMLSYIEYLRYVVSGI